MTALRDDPAATSGGGALAATLPASRDAPPAALAAPGATHADHYALGRELARGGMGRIRLATDLRLGRTVAIKEVLSQRPDAIRRFEREARITARLQHPAIVNLQEAGRWPTGTPFFAMSYVPGRSLLAAFEEARTLEARLALLPHLLAVADALAYAHGQDIVHRDLKPGNILVGTFGQTVVIDWGVAKDLAEARPPDAELAALLDPAAAEGMTLLGDVIGTPAYMPPEQADGRPVDARADVYAIGALLDHLLTGAPPYPDGTATAVLEAVRRGPPPPLAARAPAAPPELVAIVERAMAREPAERYPTARELSDDLRRYQAGRLVAAHRYSVRALLRRWLRRHRAVIAVATVAALAILTAGGVGLQRTVAAEHRADASRRAAEGLLEFMLGDLRAKLSSVGRLDLLDAVARKAVAYFGDRHDVLDAAEEAKQGLAQRVLGDVLDAQGDARAALTAYRAAIAIDVALVGPAGLGASDDRQTRALASDHLNASDALVQLGDSSAALAETRAALDLLVALPQARAIAAAGVAAQPRPADRDLARDLAVTHLRLGQRLTALSDSAGALREFETARAIDAALADAAPADATLIRALGDDRAAIGNARLARADTAGAIDDLREALRLQASVRAARPGDVDAIRAVASAHAALGQALAIHGDGDEAVRELRAAVASAEAAATADPTSATGQELVADSQTHLADLLDEQGDEDQALATHQVALANRERAATRHPSNAAAQRALSVSHDRLGTLRLGRGETAEALRHYRASAALGEALAARDPNNTRLQLDLSIGRSQVGTVLLATGDAAGAVVEFDAALALAEALTARDPANSEWQSEAATCQLDLGDARLATHDLDGAAAAYEAGRARLAQLAARDPGNADTPRHIARGLAKLAEVALARHELPTALDLARAALVMRQAQLAEDPSNADAAADLASSEATLGDVLRVARDLPAALAMARGALARRAALAARAPSSAERHDDLAASHALLGATLRDGGDAVAAAAAYQAALAVARRQLTRDPANRRRLERVAELAREVAR